MSFQTDPTSFLLLLRRVIRRTVLAFGSTVTHMSIDRVSSPIYFRLICFTNSLIEEKIRFNSKLAMTNSLASRSFHTSHNDNSQTFPDSRKFISKTLTDDSLLFLSCCVFIDSIQYGTSCIILCMF